MPVPPEAVSREMDRFKSLTASFRERFEGEAGAVGGSDEERERIYHILVSLNDLLEDRLRKT